MANFVIPFSIEQPNKRYYLDFIKEIAYNI